MLSQQLPELFAQIRIERSADKRGALNFARDAPMATHDLPCSMRVVPLARGQALPDRALALCERDQCERNRSYYLALQAPVRSPARLWRLRYELESAPKNRQISRSV
jgi:hypothetical protein